MTLPGRYVLSRRALLAAEALAAGTRPEPEGLQALTEAGVADGGRLFPPLHEALGVLAHPDLLINARARRAGEPVSRDLRVAGRRGGDFVAAGGTPEIADIVVLGPSPVAAVHLAGFLGLTTPALPDRGASFAFGPGGLHVLAAAARLAGGGAPRAGDALDGIAAAFAAGESGGSELLLNGGGRTIPFEAALGSARQAGFIEAGTGLNLTPLGAELAAGLAQTLCWGRVTIEAPENGGRHGTLTSARTLATNLVVGWDATGAGGLLTVCDAPAAAMLIHRGIDEVAGQAGAAVVPPPEPIAARFCSSCGRALRPGAAYCSGCGRAVAG